MKNFALDGRVAVVTGGNGGIGLGIAEALASAGASIAIWATDEAKSRRAVEDLAAGGAEAIAVRCDIADERQVDEAMAQTVERLGGVDSFFANAGVPGDGSAFASTSLEEWRRVTGVNLDGTFLTLRAASRQMIEQARGGSLVVTSSATAVQGAPRNEAYAAAKAGVGAIARALAVELARYQIRANAIMPGWIETDLNRDLLASDPFQERVLPRVPARRWGTPTDIGGVAIYLASPASGYHTGDTLVLDGGFSLG